MVDQNQIKAMGDIMARLNSISSMDDTPYQRPAQSAINEGASRSTHSDASVREMGDIMARFRQATSNVRDDAQTNDMLLEALQTERTSTGVRVAEWEVVITEADNLPGKFYDVIRDDINIATNLRLYEAAEMLMRELNEGNSITSTRVRRILALEAAYASAFDQAILYANMVKTSSGSKQQIAKTKLSEAKNKAMAAKQQIREVR